MSQSTYPAVELLWEKYSYNPFTNCPWNLREVTSRQNIQNRGNFGGTWVERKQKWLGYHRTQADAVAAYWRAVECYGLADVRTL
jgi:hypothetical protein